MTAKLFIGISGIIVDIIALFALVGIWLNIKGWYGWLSDAGMAFNTAICFLFVGTSFIILSLRKSS